VWAMTAPSPRPAPVTNAVPMVRGQ
jgi:hypothetical protein